MVHDLFRGRKPPTYRDEIIYLLPSYEVPSTSQYHKNNIHAIVMWWKKSAQMSWSNELDSKDLLKMLAKSEEVHQMVVKKMQFTTVQSVKNNHQNKIQKIADG